ncbi:hypothetical protein V6N11_003290 [Hibiscus sabdariffa]|uniref:Peptidase M14 domain-containing protein n=1 Tax=Hibiscus sabdariffa TaxID=183260 RepID=A0ABR2SCS8_9ROSI
MLSFRQPGRSSCHAAGKWVVHFFLFFFLVSFTGLSSVYATVGLPKLFPTPTNHDLYHSGAGLIEKINSLVHRHPEKLTVETLKSGTEGYNADVTGFGQHSRELITPELALRIMSILSEEQFLTGTDHGSLNGTLENLVIKGEELISTGIGDYDPVEEYPGTAPFSEPETQIMREVATSFDPHIWVNVHSGMAALFMPYDHKKSTPDGLPSQRTIALIEELNKVHCHGRCKTGSGGASVGYLAHGTATDYMYDVVREPMPFTFEIFAGDKTLEEDCFKMFNPVDRPPSR